MSYPKHMTPAQQARALEGLALPRPTPKESLDFQPHPWPPTPKGFSGPLDRPVRPLRLDWTIPAHPRCNGVPVPLVSIHDRLEAVRMTQRDGIQEPLVRVLGTALLRSQTGNDRAVTIGDWPEYPPSGPMNQLPEYVPSNDYRRRYRVAL